LERLWIATCEEKLFHYFYYFHQVLKVLFLVKFLICFTRYANFSAR